jgi:hypothetical protein
LLEELAGGDEPYALSADEQAAIEEGLGQMARGEVISDPEFDALLRRPWGKA